MFQVHGQYFQAVLLDLRGDPAKIHPATVRQNLPQRDISVEPPSPMKGRVS
jgi:hypothetical protein